jgi:CBS domain-containing protein
MTKMTQKSTAAAQRTMARPSVTARDIMQRPVVAATTLASLREVATELARNGFTGMPVADPDGKVLGVVTESDIVRTLIAGKRLENLTAGEVMTGPPITVGVETPIEEVMKQLEENRIVRVPVTDHDKLIGIISRRDVIRAVLEPEFMEFGE